MPSKEWFHHAEDRVHQWSTHFGERFDAWLQRLDSDSKDLFNKLNVLLHIARLNLAETHPLCLASNRDSNYYLELIEGYRRAREEFLRSLTSSIAIEVKYLPGQEAARHARWVCGSTIEWLIKLCPRADPLIPEQLLLTGKSVFQKGVELSEQLGSEVIDPSWVRQVSENLSSLETASQLLEGQTISTFIFPAWKALFS